MKYDVLKSVVRFKEFGQRHADLFISEMEQKEYKISRVYRADKGYGDDGLHSNIRHSYQITVPGSHPFIKDAARAVRHSNEDFFKTNILPEMYCIENTLLKYPETGHFEPHMDILWPKQIGEASDRKNYIRKLSSIMIMNDPQEYEGGELAFWNDNETFRVAINKGDLFVFPSYVRHVVRPVKKGVRYSLVMWSHGQF